MHSIQFFFSFPLDLSFRTFMIVPKMKKYFFYITLFSRALNMYVTLLCLKHKYLIKDITHYLFNSWLGTMSLFDSFKDVYDKIFVTGGINIDNIIFKLHYRVTVTALVIFSVVLSLGQVKTTIFHQVMIFFKNCFIELKMNVI